MTTLITGGTGRSGLSLAKFLQAANRPVVIASRSGEAPKPFKAAKFDWYDSKTYENALSDNSIDRVYIVGPPGSKDSAIIIAFIYFAISKGVKRFVLMSASHFKPQAESYVPASVVHKYLLDKGVDYVVLRPTWFIRESLILHQYSLYNHLKTSQRTSAPISLPASEKTTRSFQPHRLGLFLGYQRRILHKSLLRL